MVPRPRPVCAKGEMIPTIRPVCPTVALGAHLRRRSLLAAAIAGIGTACTSARADPVAEADWRAFKTGYLSDDGRIIDTANGGVSHSEGQGWGLLFAEAFGDSSSFDRILTYDLGPAEMANQIGQAMAG